MSVNQSSEVSIENCQTLILSKSQFRVFFASPNPNEYIKSILSIVDFNHATFQPLKMFLTKIFQNEYFFDKNMQSLE